MNWFRRNWLYLLAFTLPFERIPSYDISLAGHSITLRASFILALVVVTGGAWEVVRRRRTGLSLPDKWLAAYVLVMVASAGLAFSRGRSLQVIFATTLMIGLAMVVEQALAQFSLGKLYRYLMAAALITCAFGLFQFIGDSLGLSTAFTGLREIYTKHVFGFPRVQSVAQEPLFFASFLLLPIMVLIARIYTRAAGIKTYITLWFITGVLALTLSRGGIYGGLGALVLLAVLLYPQGSLRRLGLVVVTIGVAAGCAVGLIAVTARVAHEPAGAVHAYVAQTTHLTSNPGSPDSDRSINRRLAINAFKQHPLLGVGIGNFGYYAQRNYPGYANDPAVVANNEYLEIPAETGVVGVLALAGFCAALLWQVYRSWKRLTSEARMWAGGLVAMLFGAAIQFYSFSTLYIIHIWFAVGLLLALTASVLTKKDAAPEKA